MKETISSILHDSANMKQAMLSDNLFLEAVALAASKLREAVLAGGTIYACGNGGSACDAMHFVEELVARYKRERPGIRAMHFQDAGILSCWSNDYSFDSVFARQAETFCKSGDVLVALSTSGNSTNIQQAVEVAKKKSTFVIGLTGKDGGALKNSADLSLIVPSSETERIQEAHITLIHIFCELLETE